MILRQNGHFGSEMCLAPGLQLSLLIVTFYNHPTFLEYLDEEGTFFWLLTMLSDVPRQMSHKTLNHCICPFRILFEL